MVKRKFGAAVRAKAAPRADLVHAIHELGIEPSFWSRMEAARAFDAPIGAVLTGAAIPPGTCRHCGHVNEG